MPTNNTVDYEARLRLIEYRQDQIDYKLDKMNGKLDELIQQPANDAKKYKWLIAGFILEAIVALVILGAGTWVVKTNQAAQHQVISEK